MSKSITNQSLRRLLLATLLSALVAGCGSGSTISSNNTNGLIDTGGGGGGSGGGTGGGTGGGGTAGLCTTAGLAAMDLSSLCRATPQATMGALEAVSG